MGAIAGTSGADHLIGGPGADTLIALGGADTLEGGAGGDVYQLSQPPGSTHSALIRDASTSGAPDMITGLRGFFASASLGYSAWASLERVGDDMVMHMPYKPSGFRKTGFGGIVVTIENHFAGHAVEKAQIGGVDYRLLTGLNGYGVNDVFVGDAAGEVVRLRYGADIAYGGGGDDTIFAGHGDDTAFGDAGADELRMARGHDRAYGGDGNDRIYGGGGRDWLYGDAGDDQVRGGAQDDWLYGDAGNDKVFGGGGWDRLTGGEGDDFLVGGKGGDIYDFAVDGAGFGHDVIWDNGSVAAYSAARGAVSSDTIRVSGVYGPGGAPQDISDSMAIERIGADMKLSFDVDGAQSSITVRGEFAANQKNAIENLQFFAAYWTPVSFRIAAADLQGVGEGRSYGTPAYDHQINELLFGTDGDEVFFSGNGRNLIWTGGGADVLEYRLGSGPQDHFIGTELYIGEVVDTVMDFDVTADRLDFREIQAIGFQSLGITEDAEGDARIHWNAGSFEFANISIELRGVAAVDVTADIMFFA